MGEPLVKVEDRKKWAALLPFLPEYSQPEEDKKKNGAGIVSPTIAVPFAHSSKATIMGF